MAPFGFGVQVRKVIRYIPHLVGLFTVFHFAKDHVRRLEQRVGARIINNLGTSHTWKTKRQKQRLFAELHDLAADRLNLSVSTNSGDGSDSTINPERLLVVEIGAGGGTNFQFYPDNIKVVCIDPNPSYEEYLKEKSKLYPQLELEYCEGVGEDLSHIDTESVDAVVITLVFCCVKDINACIHEIKRILKPVCIKTL